VKRVLLALIRAYQRWISPAFPRRCKYHPTCSDYAVQAVRELGPLRGSIVAGWRVLRCNPLSAGGIDDLADRKLFSDAGTTAERSRSPEPPPKRLAGAGR
jgi:putative membrane protein insertion efficiency factor